MKAVINTASNYKRLNGQQLDVVRNIEGSKTVTCLHNGQEIDFARSEISITR